MLKLVDSALKIPICGRVSKSRFPLQPYYSRGENYKFYSTSHHTNRMCIAREMPVNVFTVTKNIRESGNPGILKKAENSTLRVPREVTQVDSSPPAQVTRRVEFIILPSRVIRLQGNS